MKLKAIYASVAGAILLGGATASLAAQEVICDRQPTRSTPASCVIKGTSDRVMVPADSAQYVIVPAENVVVQERVVTRSGTEVATPVEPMTMTYYVDDPYPFPSPEAGPVQTRVYVPVEPRVVERGPASPRFDRNPMSD